MAYSKRALVATTVTLGLLFPRDSHTSHLGSFLVSFTYSLNLFQVSQTCRAVSHGIVDLHRSLLTRPGSVQTVPATRLSFFPKCLNSFTKIRLTYVNDSCGVELKSPTNGEEISATCHTPLPSTLLGGSASRHKFP
jgi:hypothetical protein